jgi:hypothetical protein
MSDAYLASVVWQRMTMSERERRDYEEATGRLAAGWSHGLHPALRAIRIMKSSPSSVRASRASACGS